LIGGVEMPEVRNCRRCGRIFNYIGGAPICSNCKEQDEVEFRKIKEYLYENPRAALSEVSTVLDVSVEKIKRFLKEGRLEIVGDDGNFVLECENCGKSIRTGRFCEICEKELSGNLQTASKRMNDAISKMESTRKSIGMRYLNKDEK
jgi:flagellar operon protein (TIGR03826 family)